MVREEVVGAMATCGGYSGSMREEQEVQQQEAQQHWRAAALAAPSRRRAARLDQPAWGRSAETGACQTKHTAAAGRKRSAWKARLSSSTTSLPPSRVGQRVAIGIATERSEATRLKDSLSLSRVGQHVAIIIATERSATTRLKDALARPCPGLVTVPAAGRHSPPNTLRSAILGGC